MQSDPYDFIMNTGSAPKKSLLPGPGSSLKSRLIVAIGGGTALLVIVLIIFALLTSGGPSNSEQLMSIVQQQNELVRVSGIGVEKARNLEAKNLAVTAKLTLTTDQQTLIAALKQQGVKVDPKRLGAAKNSKTDDMLTAAEQSNRFDDVFLEHLQEELTKYQQNLKTTYDATSSQSLKTTLAAQYEHASLIIGAKTEL